MYTLPTLLTFARIAMIPVFVIIYYLPWKGANDACTIIFALAAITDWFDGYLARRWDQTTLFGAFLDPVADKLMVAVALVLLVQTESSAYFAIPAAVIICREIAVSALREWMAEIGERAQVAVSSLGKFKTTAQMLAILFLLYRDPIGEFPTITVGYVLFYVAAILTLWSMALYLHAAWPVLKNNAVSDDNSLDS